MFEFGAILKGLNHLIDRKLISIGGKDGGKGRWFALAVPANHGVICIDVPGPQRIERQGAKAAGEPQHGQFGVTGFA